MSLKTSKQERIELLSARREKYASLAPRYKKARIIDSQEITSCNLRANFEALRLTENLIFFAAKVVVRVPVLDFYQ